MHPPDDVVRQGTLQYHMGPAIVIDHLAVHPVDEADGVLGQHLGRGSDLVHSPRSAHDDDLVRVLRGDVLIVVGYDCRYVVVLRQLCCSSVT